MENYCASKADVRANICNKTIENINNFIEERYAFKELNAGFKNHFLLVFYSGITTEMCVVWLPSVEFALANCYQFNPVM